MGQKKTVKLEDIAEELGVSIVSVSNALNGKKGVGEALRSRVLRKAEELGYELPQPVEKKSVDSYRIGIVIAERYVREYPSFYMDIYKQVAQAAARQGSLTVLEIIDSEKEKLNYEFSFFQNVDIQGMILIGEMKQGFIRYMKDQMAVPMVCVDFFGMEKDMDYILADSFHGTAALTQVLIGAGHKDIGFVGTPRATNSIMDRYMGYCKALAANGLEERKDRVFFDREEDGYGYLIDISLPDELPTAFVCNCDKTAYCLIEKLKQRGLQVPEDISVVGFDHFYPASGAGAAELTTYEIDGRAMAQISVNTLIRRIEGKSKAEGCRIVEGRVIMGNTVKVVKR